MSLYVMRSSQSAALVHLQRACINLWTSARLRDLMASATLVCTPLVGHAVDMTVHWTSRYTILLAIHSGSIYLLERNRDSCLSIFPWLRDRLDQVLFGVRRVSDHCNNLARDGLRYLTRAKVLARS